MARGVEQSTMEEIRKERMGKGETQEYATKDKTMEKTVEVKRNHLSMPAMHHSQTIPSTERAHKDTL